MDDVDAMIATIVKLEGALMFDAGCAPRIEMDNPDVWLCTTQRRFGTFDKPSLAALLGCDERVRGGPIQGRGATLAQAVKECRDKIVLYAREIAPVYAATAAVLASAE